MALKRVVLGTRTNVMYLFRYNSSPIPVAEEHMSSFASLKMAERCETVCCLMNALYMVRRSWFHFIYHIGVLFVWSMFCFGVDLCGANRSIA